jgi:hypothetical protein
LDLGTPGAGGEGKVRGAGETPHGKTWRVCAGSLSRAAHGRPKGSCVGTKYVHLRAQLACSGWSKTRRKKQGAIRRRLHAGTTWAR